MQENTSRIISVGNEILKSLSYLHLNRAQILLHSSFNRVTNYYLPHSDYFFSLVREEIGAGPYHLVVNNNFPLDLSLINFLELQLVNNEKIWFSRLSEQNLNLEKACAKVLTFKDYIVQTAPPKSLAFLLDKEREKNFSGAFDKILVEKLKKGAQLLSESHDLIHMKEGISFMKGSGIGLTPAGDDFIAGFIWGLHFQRVSEDVILELREISRSKNLLVDHFLSLSAKALMNEKQKKAFTALSKGQFAGEFDWGETSAYDFAVGLYFGIRDRR
jgi:hypothetical protein